MERIQRIITNLEKLTGKTVVLEDVVNNNEKCPVCNGEGFDQHGAQCLECSTMPLNEKDKEGGVRATGEPIQFYAPKGTRKKLMQMAKHAGTFTMSDYIRNKLFGKR